MNDLVNAIQSHDVVEFRNTYRTYNILMIDDIQFIAGKERTQEEFFHTFNDLYNSQRQIVLSSDRSPREMATLEDRLRSRFEWGMIADLQPPDLETRIAILRKKAMLLDVDLPDDVSYLIANHIKADVRKLEERSTALCSRARSCISAPSPRIWPMRCFEICWIAANRRSPSSASRRWSQPTLRCRYIC